MSSASVHAASAPGRCGRARRWRRIDADEWRAFGFVVPLVVMEILFVAVPLVIGVYYSFYRVD